MIEVVVNKVFIIVFLLLPSCHLFSNWVPFLSNFTYQYSANKYEILAISFTEPVFANENQVIYSHKHILNRSNYCFDTLLKFPSIFSFLPFNLLDSIVYNNKYIYLTSTTHKIPISDSVGTSFITADTSKKGITSHKYIIREKYPTITFNSQDSLIVIDKYTRNPNVANFTFIGALILSKKFGFIELILPDDSGPYKLVGLSDGNSTFGSYVHTKLEEQRIIEQISSRKTGDKYCWNVYYNPTSKNNRILIDSIVSVDMADSILTLHVYRETFHTSNEVDYYLIATSFEKITFDLKYFKSIIASNTSSWQIPKGTLPFFKDLDGLMMVPYKSPIALLGNDNFSICIASFGLYINPINCKFAFIIDEHPSITFDSKYGISKIKLGFDSMVLLGILKSDGTKIGHYFKPNNVSDVINLSLSLSPNPVTDKLTLINIPDNATEFEIYDQFGNRQISGLISGQIDVSLLPAGVYFIKLNNSQRPLKFLKI